MCDTSRTFMLLGAAHAFDFVFACCFPLCAYSKYAGVRTPRLSVFRAATGSLASPSALRILIVVSPLMLM